MSYLVLIKEVLFARFYLRNCSVSPISQNGLALSSSFTFGSDSLSCFRPLSAYTPEYAEKPPSTGRTTPVINPAASLFRRNKRLPINSSDSPKRPIGVAARILPVRGVGVPSSLNNNLAFCFVEKNPGAIAFTRMPAFEK